MGNVESHTHFEGKSTHKGEEVGEYQVNARSNILVLPLSQMENGTTNNDGPGSCLERQNSPKDPVPCKKCNVPIQ